MGQKADVALFLAFELLMVGCSGRVKPFKVDTVACSEAAIKQYDKNGDGALDENELKACPALLKELGAYDKSKDKKLVREEIEEQLREMYDRGSGMTSMDCTITLDGQPLSNATVKFIPEDFLGTEIKAASGITNSSGVAPLGIPDEDMPKILRGHPLMRVGIYRVEITHPTRKIPAKYNTNTELGFEFHKTNHVQPPVYNLVSK